MAFGPLDPLQWRAAAPEAMDDAAAPAQIDPHQPPAFLSTAAEKQVAGIQAEQPFGTLDGQLQVQSKPPSVETELSSSSLRSARLRRCSTSQLPSTRQGRRANLESPPGSAEA